MQRKYQYVASKWTKAQLLMKHEKIRPFVPDTRLLTYQDLVEMLSIYPMVYVKPDNGMKGKGIIRITYKNERYEMQTEARVQSFISIDDLTQSLRSLIKNHKFVIQQGVSLISYNEHPIDFRVLMQKPKNEWVCSGIVGKLGEKNSIVTNYALGGKAIPFGRTIHEILGWSFEEVKALRDRIGQLSYWIASQLTTSYPGLRELGIDIAIDVNGEVWLLEVNTTPGHQLFRKLPNEEIYKRIVQNVRMINANPTSF